MWASLLCISQKYRGSVAATVKYCLSCILSYTLTALCILLQSTWTPSLCCTLSWLNILLLLYQNYHIKAPLWQIWNAWSSQHLGHRRNLSYKGSLFKMDFQSSHKCMMYQKYTWWQMSQPVAGGTCDTSGALLSWSPKKHVNQKWWWCISKFSTFSEPGEAVQLSSFIKPDVRFFFQTFAT